MNIWTCKIGEVEEGVLPKGSDAPFRRAVYRTYKELTGREPDYIFSGWGGELTEGERAAHEDRSPEYEKTPLMLPEVRALLAAVFGDDFNVNDLDHAIAKLSYIEEKTK